MAQSRRSLDLTEMHEALVAAVNRGDVDAYMRPFAVHATWDASRTGGAVYEGADEIRALVEDWLSVFADFEVSAAGIEVFGDRVSVVTVVQSGRLPDSIRPVDMRYVCTTQWLNGLIARATNYTDIDEARAAAKRLVEGSE